MAAMKYAMTMAVGFFIGLFAAGVEVNAHARPRPMVCGDVNADAAVTVSDALRTLASQSGWMCGCGATTAGATTTNNPLA